MDDAPIGILDSGSGGLSLWQEIIRLLPAESTVYVGDHGNMPYSDKTTEDIRRRVFRIIQFLIGKNAKIIVIACNTATVAGIDIYRKRFPYIPIVGVVPVIKTAVEMSKKRHIAVLSTQYTSRSTYQKKLIRQFAAHCVVESIGSTRLVLLIEAGDGSQTAIKKELTRLLAPFIGDTVDVLVLGCTHYPFVRDQIRAIVGERVSILDSGGAVARHIQHMLKQKSMFSLKKNPVYRFYTTGDRYHVEHVASALLGKKIHVTYVAI